ncbi:hypothetical protein NC651_039860 [Populus alba x Populus x berolinensis]|nr:hypothetical protein NC651_039860 [Populus alba x Populus x berolinensis]
MSGSLGGWIFKNSPIPITKKPDLNDPLLRVKLAKGMGTIACNVGLAVLKLSMIGEPAHLFAIRLEILPEWYFFPVFQILRTVPNKLLGVLLMVSVLAGLLTVPFLENVNKFQNPFCRPVETTNAKYMFYIFYAKMFNFHKPIYHEKQKGVKLPHRHHAATIYERDLGPVMIELHLHHLQ